MTPRWLGRLLPLAALAVALPAASAHAATLTEEAGVLVYKSAEPAGATVYVRNSWNPEGKVRFEGSAKLTSVPGSCDQRDDETVDCVVPSAIRVELGAGNDSFGFGDGYTLSIPITVLGGGGNDRLDGDADVASPEVLDGGAGNDRIDGFGGDDQVLGGPGDDDLEGNGGADVVQGGDGNDTLAGDDQASPAADVIDGGAGNDILKDYVEYGTDLHPPANVSLDGAANDGREGEGDNVTGVERMIAYVSGTFVLSDGAEDWQVWSNMNSGDSVIDARGGNDKVVGEDAKETIDGGAGDDYLEGGKNHDVITGGPGKDTIFGDDTDATCNSAYVESCVLYGNDVINARDGEADQVDCGAGTDTVNADAADVVAANCETVNRGGGPGNPGNPGNPGQPGQPGRPALALAGSKKLGTVLKRGLKLRLTGAAPGPAKVTARLKGAMVASKAVTVAADGTASVKLKLKASAAKRLKRARSAKLVVDAPGATLAVTLKR